MNRLTGMTGLVLGLVVLTALRLYLAATVPLTADEAYYWVWSRHMQGGYLDHPFMVALWIRLGTWICGDTPLGVRLLGPLSVVPGSILLIQAANHLWGKIAGVRIGIRAVWLLNATLMVGLGCATMTPDTPLVFFITLTLYALSRAITAETGVQQAGWWCLVGGALGLGFDSKYTAVLIGVALAGSLLTAKRWRTRVAPWCGVVSFAMCVLPVVLWNKAHHWASFLKQGGRTGDWHPARAVQFLGELLGGQIGLATPFIFCVFGAGLFVAWRRRRVDFGLWALVWMGVLPLLVFMQHALGDRVQANWPSVVYPVWALIGAQVAMRVRWAVLSGFVLFAAVFAHAVWHLPAVPVKQDLLARQTAGWSRFAESAHEQAQAVQAEAIAVDDYGVASELAHAQLGLPIIGLDPRWSFLGLPTRSFHKVFIINDIHPNTPTKHTLCRAVEGSVIRCYRIQVKDISAGIVLP